MRLKPTPSEMVCPHKALVVRAAITCALCPCPPAKRYACGWQLIGWRRSSDAWASHPAETAMDVDMRSCRFIAPPPTPSEMLLGLIRRGRSAHRPLDSLQQELPSPGLLTNPHSTPILSAHTIGSSQKPAASPQTPSALHKPQSPNPRCFADFAADLAHADFVHQQLALASSLHAEVLTTHQHVRARARRYTHAHTHKHTGTRVNCPAY